MKETINKNVIGMWAALKGLLVIAVVFRHSIDDAANILGTMEYPLPFRVIAKGGGVILFTFFMINGYLFKVKKKKGGIRKEYQEYLKIYFITIFAMLLGLVIHNCLRSLYPWRRVFPLLAGALYGATNMCRVFGRRLQFPYAMWFFAVLMNAWLALQLIMKIKKKSIQRLVIFGIPALFFLFCHVTGMVHGFPFAKYPFYLVQTSVTVMLLYLGYWLKKENIFFKKLPWYMWTIIVLTSGAVFILGKVDMLNNGYRLGAADFIGNSFCAFLVMYLYIRYVNPDYKIVERLMWLGRRSLWIIPIHCVEWTLFGWHEYGRLEGLGMYGATFVIFITRSCIIIAACMALEKMKAYYSRKNSEGFERRAHGN